MTESEQILYANQHRQDLLGIVTRHCFSDPGKKLRSGAIVRFSHYENLPMQYTEIFKVVRNENVQYKFCFIFLIFAQNIDCGYTLEPPRLGGSNEYPQSMFLSKNKKNRYNPAYPSFAI